MATCPRNHAMSCCSPKQDPNVVGLEEIVAASAAIQNMLLAAHTLGLGAKLRTGKQLIGRRLRSSSA